MCEKALSVGQPARSLSLLAVASCAEKENFSLKSRGGEAFVKCNVPMIRSSNVSSAINKQTCD